MNREAAPDRDLGRKGHGMQTWGCGGVQAELGSSRPLWLSSLGLRFTQLLANHLEQAWK